MRAVFFDMDGVIFDSMPHHARAWDTVMRRYDLPFTAYDCYLQEGRTGQSVIDECYVRVHGRHATDEEWRTIYNEKKRIFRELGDALPIPHILDVLTFLREHDVDIWIVTGSGQESLFVRLDTNFPGLFDRSRMITANDVTHGKPDPEPYLKAWQRTGYDKSDCLVVENAPLGLRSAKAAGLFAVGVNTGILKQEDLAAAGADLVFNDMTQLLLWLKKNV